MEFFTVQHRTQAVKCQLVAVAGERRNVQPLRISPYYAHAQSIVRAEQVEFCFFRPSENYLDYAP